MKNEPIINTAGALSLLALLIDAALRAGWVHFTDKQVGILMAAAAIVFPLLVGIIARQWVSPVGRKVVAEITTALNALPAKPNATSLITAAEAVAKDFVPVTTGTTVVGPTTGIEHAVPDGAPAQP